MAKLCKFHRNRNTRLREKAKQTHTHTHRDTLRYYIIVVIITIVVRQYRDYCKPGASALACSQVAMGGSRSSRSTSICRVFQPTHPQTNQIFFIMLALRKAGLLREQATGFIQYFLISYRTGKYVVFVAIDHVTDGSCRWARDRRQLPLGT